MATNQAPEHVPKKFVWSGEEGHRLCRDILKHKLPYEPYQVQVEGVCKVFANTRFICKKICWRRYGKI